MESLIPDQRLNYAGEPHRISQRNKESRFCTVISSQRTACWTMLLGPMGFEQLEFEKVLVDVLSRSTFAKDAITVAG